MDIVCFKAVVEGSVCVLELEATLSGSSVVIFLLESDNDDDCRGSNDDDGDFLEKN